jgi:DNA-binding GntR family transcriptional regulator
MDQGVPKNSSVESQDIVEGLKAGIMAFKPGQRLVELQLCKQYGINRSKVREALRQLAQDGFVKIIPNVGAAVAELSQKDIEQTYDLLGVLEGLAARVVTSSITDEHLETLEDLLKKMAAIETSPLFFDYNKEFHSFLTSLSENDRLIRLAENLRNHVRHFFFRSLLHPHIQSAIKEHRKIVDAIKDMKPAKVEQLMRAHHLNSKIRFIKDMNKSL